MPLPLVPSPTAALSTDDLGVCVDAERVMVPMEIGETLRSLRVRNADQLVNFLFMAPDALAHALGWTTEEVLHARDGVVHQLDGFVDPALLHPAEPLDFPLGVYPP